MLASFFQNWQPRPHLPLFWHRFSFAPFHRGGAVGLWGANLARKSSFPPSSLWTTHLPFSFFSFRWGGRVASLARAKSADCGRVFFHHGVRTFSPSLGPGEECDPDPLRMTQLPIYFSTIGRWILRPSFLDGFGSTILFFLCSPCLSP